MIFVFFNYFSVFIVQFFQHRFHLLKLNCMSRLCTLPYALLLKLVIKLKFKNSIRITPNEGFAYSNANNKK